jgi:hypothetical protein
MVPEVLDPDTLEQDLLTGANDVNQLKVVPDNGNNLTLCTSWNNLTLCTSFIPSSLT